MKFSTIILSTRNQLREFYVPGEVSAWEDFEKTKECADFVDSLFGNPSVSVDIRHYTYPASWAGNAEYNNFTELKKRLRRDYRFLADYCEDSGSIHFDYNVEAKEVV